MRCRGDLYGRKNKLKFENLEFVDFFGVARIGKKLLIGVKKRSIINSKKIISKIIIRGVS